MEHRTRSDLALHEQSSYSTTDGEYLDDHVDAWGHHYIIDSAGAETRDIAPPTHVGQRVEFSGNDLTGAVTLVFGHQINSSAHTKAQMASDGAFVAMVSAMKADSLVWKVAESDDTTTAV